MKKMLCIMLTLLLCVTVLCPVFADTSESETIEKLILIAKEKFNIDDETMEFSNYYLASNVDDEKVYSLDWRSKDENSYRSITVMLNESGIISHFYDYADSKEKKPSFYTYSAAEAIDVAKAFIENIDPEKLALTGEAVADRSYNNNFRITFQREKNGIPVSGNALYCTVSGDTLAVTEYSANWQNALNFIEGDLISAEKAPLAFAKHTGYEPFYQIVSKDYENTVHLIYRSRYEENVMIDALSGEPVTYTDVVEYASTANEKVAMADAASGGASRVQLSEAELALLATVSDMLSKEEADTIARGIPEFGISKEHVLESYNTYRKETGEYSIGLSYRKENTEKEEYSYKSLQLDAATGMVTSFYNGGYSVLRNNAEEKTVPTTELKEKAIAFMQKYYPEQFAQMTEKSYFTAPESSFTFLRKVQDTKVYNNTAQIGYDNKTGVLSSFNLNWTEAEFAPVDTVAGVDAANQKAMELGEFHLQYLPVRTEDKELRAYPVYTLKARPVLDAETLKELDYRLRPVAASKAPEYTDIEGHYAEARIKKLLEHGIFLEANAEGQLEPETAISQLDFLLLLDQAIWQRNYAADTEYMYRNLVRQGILTAEEVNPTGTVSRLDGVRYLLCGLGYGEFITIPGIFVKPFDDVPEEGAGIAAVAYGLKLINGDGTSFYPDVALRRADAMVILHNYLQH